MTPQAAVERALERASASVTDAARELLFDLFESNRRGKLDVAALSAIAERAVSIARGTAPMSGGKPAEALGDNWYQCPHCGEVFEGEVPACTACKRALAVARPALEIDLGGAKLWLCPSSGDAIPSGALVQRIDWMRVECGARWFELLDEAGRGEARRQLTVAPPPNVAVVGLKDGGCTLLVHPTKYEVHVVGPQSSWIAEERGTATDLAIRELTNALYPDAPPAAPSGKAIQGKGHARDPELEAAIDADIDRPDAYLVYADWLQAQGDPRGELIVLQHGQQEFPASRFLARHARHFYGRLADAPKRLEGGGLGGATCWRWGYLQALWISNDHDDVPLEVPEALAAMLDHPSCRFLRELTVGVVDFEDNNYDEIAEVIGERELPTLQTLTLGDFISEEMELNWSHTGDLSPLYRAVPGLKKLVVRSGVVTLGTIELPVLEELVIISGGIGRDVLDSIYAAAWPKLARLSVELGQEGGITTEHLAPIFEAIRFPRVRHLGLGNSLRTDDIARHLASSKIAAQLVSLDFSESTLGDDGARALAAGRFPKLERIAARNCYLTEAGIEALRSIAKDVIGLDDQREDDGPDDRYIGAYE